MELSRAIISSVVTEKSERLKGERTYTLKVAPTATKIDVKNALRKHFDVEVATIRVMRVGAKVRAVGMGRVIPKRRAFKKMMVTLTEKSKGLDLAQFKVS
jgi:large subunit ribosomal protein L23